METKMDPRERSKILDCFNERVERNCDECSAHHSKGGSCCFGSLWEPDDEHCNECVHEIDCRYICQSKYQPHQRNSAVRDGPASRAFLAPPAKTTVYRPAPAKYENQEDQEEEIEVIQTDEPLIHRFGKDTMWGALTGATKMMHEFFRTRRWR